MTDIEFEAEAREWRRTHTFGGYVWFPERTKPVGRGGTKIRPAGISLARALEIAVGVLS